MSHPARILTHLLSKGFVLRQRDGHFSLEPPIHAAPLDVKAATENQAVIKAYWQKPFKMELRPTPREQAWGLSPMQDRALHNRAGRDNPRLFLNIDGPLAARDLHATLTRLAARHEILRTRFFCENGSTLQQVQEQAAINLAVVQLPYDIDPETWMRQQKPWWQGPDKQPERLPWCAILLRYSETRHVLCLCLHQFLVDGNGMAMLTAHLAEAFKAARTHLALPKPTSYLDYVHWFESYWCGRRLNAQLAWWRQHLAYLPETSALPVDKAAFSLLGYQEARHRFHLDEAQTRALVALSKYTGHRLKIVLLGAWVTLLSRYHSGNDLPIGVPCYTRDHASCRQTLGNYENQVILRCDLSGNPSFLQLLNRIEKLARQASPCGYAPLQKVAESILGTDRGGSYPVRGAFGFYRKPEPFRCGPVTFTVRDMHYAVQAKDLSMMLCYGGHTIAGTIGYHKGLYEEATMGRLADYFQHMLSTLPQEMGTPIHHLPLLGKQARMQLLNSWQGQEMDHPPASDLSSWFAVCARKWSQRMALVTVADPMLGNLSLEYSLLDDWANRIASSLRGKGVGIGSPVGLFLHSTADAIAAIFGIMRAGGLFVPLDPHSPSQRIERIIAATSMRRLITRTNLRDHLPESAQQLTILCTDEGSSLAGDSEAPPLPDVPEDALAYVMFTSGSTGRPKGVAASHRNVFSLIDGLNESVAEHAFSLTQENVVLQASSLAFDAATFEMFGALFAGATLVMPGEHSLDHLPEVLKKQGVDTLFLSSHLFRYMVEECSDVLCGISQVIVGGDVLSPLHVARFLDNCQRSQLFNGYGPTESTTFTTLCNLRTRGLTPHSAPIGKPLHNRTVYLLDEKLDPVPPGVRGEVYIAGPGVAQGYLGQPKVTAGRFLPDPFAEKGAGSRMYRTGDLARHLVDGNLEFLGRTDQQLKIRGHMVEPAEITSLLQDLEGVKQALVLPRPDGAGNRSLVGYVQPENEEVVFQESLRESLKLQLRSALTQKLPVDLVPLAFTIQDSFPLTVGGKIDIRALPNPLQAQEPRSNQDQRGHRLAHAWAEAQGLDYNHLHDQAAVGLAHSQARLMERLYREKGLDLGDPDLADLPRAEIARHLARLQEPLTTWDPRELESQDLLEKPPTSVEQLCFLQLHQGPESGADSSCNLALSVHLLGRTSPRQLKAAMDLLLARHEILRTTFPHLHQQRVHEPHSGEVRLLDLSGLSKAERDSEMGRCLLAEARRPFDLRTDFPLRCLLVRQKDGEHRLLLVAHRVAADESTLVLILHELADMFFQVVKEAGSPKQPRLQYGQYATWQKQWLDSEAGVHYDYWRKVLDGAPMLPQLWYQKTEAQTSYAGGDHLFHFPESLSTSLISLSRGSDNPLSVICHAAFTMLLAQYSGQTDLVVGWRVANRPTDSLEHMAGPLSNTLPLRVNLSGDPMFWELTDSIRRMVREARTHRAVPYPKIMEVAEVATRSPVCPIVYSWDMQLESYRLLGMQLKPSWLPTGRALSELYLHVAETDGGLMGHVVFNKNLFDPRTIQRMGDHLRNLLEHIAQRPDDHISTLSLLSAHERETLLRVWNETTTAPRDRSLPRLFEDMAARIPHAVALRTPAQALAAHNGRFTYARLNRLANHLAHQLTAKGLSHGMQVALHLEPGPAYMVGLLAVLKVGGVCVPLPQGIDSETMESLFEDHHIPILLTTGDLVHPGEAGITVSLSKSYDVQVDDAAGLNPADTVRPQHRAFLFCFNRHGRAWPLYVSHHSLSNACWWYKTHLRDDGVSLAYAPNHLPESIHEVFAAFGTGGKLVLSPPERSFHVESFLRLVNQEDVSRLFLPHFAAKRLAYHFPKHQASLEQVLELVIYGDVPRDTAESEQLRGHLPNAEVYYRLDADLLTSISFCSQREVGLGESGPYLTGRPLDNLRFYLLDRFLRPVPVGVPGRLFVGGVAVPDAVISGSKAARMMVPDPFGSYLEGRSAGSRIIETGFMARFIPGDNGIPQGLKIMGRWDDRFLFQNHIVHLSHIARKLASHAQVWEAKVVAGDHKQLQATLWCDPECLDDPLFMERLKNAVQTQLGPYASTIVLALADIRQIS